MRIITYDVEIEKEVEDFPDRWDAARDGRCGLASLALYDTDTGRVHLYDRRGLNQAIAHLNSATLLVGFNSIGFDKPCIEGVAQIDGLANQKIEVEQCDILDYVWKAIGTRHKGWGLGPICQRTLGLVKSGTGEHAPKLYKEGRFAELHDYNINDVHLTRMLFNHLVDESYVIAPDDRKVEICLKLQTTMYA